MDVQNVIKDSLLKVRVVTNASKNEMRSIEEGVVKIALNAPAREGEANKELLIFLKKEFKLKGKIIKGLKNRDKTVKILND